MGSVIMSVLDNQSYWTETMANFNHGRNALHLAVLVEPYLEYLLEGKKTIETRFSLTKQAPYQKIEKGDVIMLKRPGGPVVGLCEVDSAWFYHLNSSSWRTINEDFFHEICVQDPDFWHKKKSANYATLIRIKMPLRIRPMEYIKRDRRGWVVVVPPNRQERLYPR